MYKYVADLWENWLPPTAVQTLRKGEFNRMLKSYSSFQILHCKRTKSFQIVSFHQKMITCNTTVRSVSRFCSPRSASTCRSKVSNHLSVLFTGAALYALSSVLLISNKFWDWTGPVRGSQWALESPVSSAVMLLYHPSAVMLLYHPRLNLENS